MSPEQIASFLLGGAFTARSFSTGMPAYERLGSALVAAGFVRRALSGAPLAESLGQLSAQERAPLRLPPMQFKKRVAKNIDERVGYIGEQMMIGVRDPRVYSLARTLVTKKCGKDWCIPERDFKAEIEACFNEVRRRVRYTLDPVDFDAFQEPARTLQLAAGDCDDEVALLGAMLRSIGHDTRLRVVHTTNSPSKTWNHIYLLAKPGGAAPWVALDPTVRAPPGWEVPSHLVVKKRDYEVR